MTKRSEKRADRGGGEVSATRGEIQEAAKRLIALQGFTATTVRQIARKVKMKAGSLYYHYGGKDEILVDILDEGNRRLLDSANRVLMRNPGDVPSTLRELIHEHIRVLAEDPAQFMVVTRELNRLKGGQRRRIVAQRDQYERVIQGVLVRGIREKSIRPCDVKIASFGLIASLNGVAYWFKPEGRLSIQQIAEEYSGVLLDGLRA